MNSFSIFFTFLALSSSVGLVFSKCHLKELDFCSASVAMLLQNQETPKTEAAINHYCEVLNEAHECVANFTSKCATPLQQELVEFFASGGLNTVKEFCTSGSQLRNNYMANVECLAKARIEANSCLKDLQVAVEEVVSVDQQNRLPVGCCAFNRFQDCTFSIVNARCGPKVVELGRKVLTMVTSRIPEAICTSFDAKSDLCLAILPKTGQNPRGNQSSSPIAKIFATFFGNSGM
ncbi:uncharacterized protein LOC107364170 [Tetranychus urticae]|uniref:DUF19 domain-containing protein n=1 Tax=Tetranychus urticae TaxID=32264 RepID=T1KGD4_TETUR|nr:uncharacterized protein LOC107364170 [Tetranychus urticae]